MAKLKLILDTDIGDDIDDAFALAIASDLPGTDLIGVTTVFRNTTKRAQQVKVLLKAVSHNDDIVYAGETTPESGIFIPLNKNDSPPFEESNPCQWSQDYECDVNRGAVDFIIENAERYGNELIVAAIGPLTNIARAIEKKPVSMRKVKKIVIMGGQFYDFSPEWNIMCDPEGADILFKSGIPVYAVGLDVTLKCTLEKQLLKKIIEKNCERNRLLKTWFERWSTFFKFEKIVMHDPLALISAVYDDVCMFKREFVKVVIQGNRGAIKVQNEQDEGFSPICVAWEVDKNKFYTIIKEKLVKH